MMHTWAVLDVEIKLDQTPTRMGEAVWGLRDAKNPRQVRVIRSDEETGVILVKALEEYGTDDGEARELGGGIVEICGVSV